MFRAAIDTAVASKAIKPAEFERLIADTTVQEKAIAHPVDSQLLEIARHKVVAAAIRALMLAPVSCSSMDFCEPGFSPHA